MYAAPLDEDEVEEQGGADVAPLSPASVPGDDDTGAGAGDGAVVEEVVVSPVAVVGGDDGGNDNDDDDDSGSDAERAPRRQRGDTSPGPGAGASVDAAAAASPAPVATGVSSINSLGKMVSPTAAAAAPGGRGGGGAGRGGGGSKPGVARGTHVPALVPLPDTAPTARRYFVAKPRNHCRMSEAVERQVWSTKEENVAAINGAIAAGATVVVFFSVNQSYSLQVKDRAG